jgi:phospholipid-binding lipoprotein MlaA
VRSVAPAALLLALLAAPVRAEEQAAPAPPCAEPAAGEEAWAAEDDWLFEDGPDPAERDAIEPSNRGVFAFNEGFYRWVADPITRGYEWLVPEPGRRAVHRFFLNLESPAIFASDLVQLAPADATRTLSRFVINSTIGVLGLLDPASELGIEAHHTDFGETLAVYGTPSGSYVVIPILGPSTARDVFGELVDAFLHPAAWFASPGQQVLLRGSGGLSYYDVEQERLDALRSTSVDFYAAIRSAYLMDRDAHVKLRRSGRWWNGAAAQGAEPEAPAVTTASPPEPSLPPSSPP